MKKYSLFTLVVAGVLLWSTAGLAATFSGGENYTLRNTERVNGDLYAGGRSVTVGGAVSGDVVAAGGNVFIDGTVSQDALLAGGTVTMNGTVRDDVRIAGGTINVAGPISGDLIIVGGQVSVLSNTAVSGDVVIAGGNVTFDGTVRGVLKIRAGKARVNGSVGSGADIRAEQVSVGPNAVIGGGLVYEAREEASIDDAARITGSVERLSGLAHPSPKDVQAGFKAFFGFIAALKFLMILVCALIAIAIARRTMTGVVEIGGTLFWKSLGIGFVAALVMPIAALIISLTVVGLPIGLLVFFAFFAWLMVSAFVSPMLMGSMVRKYWKKYPSFPVDWKITLFGVVILGILMLIPIVGWIVIGLFWLVSFGAIAQYWYTRAWRNR